MYNRLKELEDGKFLVREKKLLIKNERTSLSPALKDCNVPMFDNRISRETHNVLISTSTPEFIGPGYYKPTPIDKIYKNVDNVADSAFRRASRNAYNGAKTSHKSLNKITSLPVIKEPFQIKTRLNIPFSSMLLAKAALYFLPMLKNAKQCNATLYQSLAMLMLSNSKYRQC